MFGFRVPTLKDFGKWIYGSTASLIQGVIHHPHTQTIFEHPAAQSVIDTVETVVSSVPKEVLMFGLTQIFGLPLVAGAYALTNLAVNGQGLLSLPMSPNDVGNSTALVPFGNGIISPGLDPLFNSTSSQPNFGFMPEQPNFNTMPGFGGFGGTSTDPNAFNNVNYTSQLGNSGWFNQGFTNAIRQGFSWVGHNVLDLFTTNNQPVADNTLATYGFNNFSDTTATWVGGCLAIGGLALTGYLSYKLWQYANQQQPPQQQNNNNPPPMLNNPPPMLNNPPPVPNNPPPVPNNPPPVPNNPPPVPNNPPPQPQRRRVVPTNPMGFFAPGTNNNLRPTNPNYFADLFPTNQAVTDSILFSVDLDMEPMTDQQLQEIRQGEVKQLTNGFPYFFTHPENGSPKAVLYTRDTVVEGATPEQQTAMLLHTMMHMVLSVVFHKSDTGVVHLTGPAKIRALGQMYIEYLNQHHGLHLTTQHYQMKTVTENGESRSTSQPVEFDRSSEEWRQAEALKPSIVSKMTGVDPKYAGQREKFVKFFEARKENLDQQENGNGPPRNN